MKHRIAKKIFKLLKNERSCEKHCLDWGFCKFYHGYCDICPFNHDRLARYSLHQRYIAAKIVHKQMMNRIKYLNIILREMERS